MASKEIWERRGVQTEGIVDICDMLPNFLGELQAVMMLADTMYAEQDSSDARLVPLIEIVKIVTETADSGRILTDVRIRLNGSAYRKILRRKLNDDEINAIKQLHCVCLASDAYSSNLGCYRYNNDNLEQP
jgi:hypothetical protein